MQGIMSPEELEEVFISVSKDYIFKKKSDVL